MGRHGQTGRRRRRRLRTTVRPDTVRRPTRFRSDVRGNGRGNRRRPNSSGRVGSTGPVGAVAGRTWSPTGERTVQVDGQRQENGQRRKRTHLDGRPDRIEQESADGVHVDDEVVDATHFDRRLLEEKRKEQKNECGTSKRERERERERKRNEAHRADSGPGRIRVQASRQVEGDAGVLATDAGRRRRRLVDGAVLFLNVDDADGSSGFQHVPVRVDA